ncbi:MAG TPA: helicase C-terminal domain-containing protein [Candidatus Saccharimonadales bacterium]|nr:helicase C-terminal domain-containing protein [Candidatus Saccharimonadales bacterium]
MNRRDHLGPLTFDELSSAFPRQYREMHPNQREAFERIAQVGGSVTLEAPTGSGKTAIGYATLRALAERGEGPLFYVVPNKALVGQVHTLHRDLTEVYGRNEYECLYFPEENYRADEIPCLLLTDCVHRVDQETGETFGRGRRCPYYWAKYQAKQSPIVVCTMAFYLFTQLFSREWEEPAGLVIDEAHQIAKVVRNALSFEISGYHLARAIRLLEPFAPEGAAGLEEFLSTMNRIVRVKRSNTPSLLEDTEVQELLMVLMLIDHDLLQRRLQSAVTSGAIDVGQHVEVLTRVERIVRDLVRYLRAFEFSLPTENRNPLNYTFAYHEREPVEGRRVNNRLVVKAYHVAPLVRSLLSSSMTLAYSATIGDENIFGFETGIRQPTFHFGSDFPNENTRVFMPTNTPNLAMQSRGRRDLANSIRRMARACRRFNDAGHRCLVIVVSDAERQRFLRMAIEEGVDVVTYGDGVSARLAAERFRDRGDGGVLCGTAANYGEGIDLPDGRAPVIFFLRPAYPSPQDPATQFEERRFGSRRWSVWNWRVMMEALQVRGRNVRGATDLGVTFFISQQFRRFLYGSLPNWLQPAYRGELTFDEGIEEALEVLGR